MARTADPGRRRTALTIAAVFGGLAAAVAVIPPLEVEP
jgi:hypothetical protein